MLSLTRLVGFLAGVLILYLFWRVSRAAWRIQLRGIAPELSFWLGELGTLVLSVVLLLAFLAAGALWHRPMLSLAGVPPGRLVVDFHSHTNRSHDVRNTLMRDFDAESSRRWHGRAGFDAFFITDHNVAADRGAGARRAGAGSRMQRAIVCPGIEVSAWRAHIVLLGETPPLEGRGYRDSLTGLLTLLRVSDTAFGALSVASIPEYRRNHWERLDQLIAAGLDGFEVVNASPKANELTRQDRDSVIALARSHKRFVVGVSDSHGWGATSMVWNLIQLPTGLQATQVCPAVLKELRTGFAAVQIIERHRLRPRPDSWWPLSLTPLGLVWEGWRSMGWPLTASWLVWIWLPFLPMLRSRANIAR